MATDYGSRLKQARKNAGMTQAQLAAKTDVPQSTISTAEREGMGSRETPVYAQALGVDALWLATGQAPLGEKIPPNAGAYGSNVVVARMDGSGAAINNRASIQNIGEQLKTMSQGRKTAILALLAEYEKDPERITKEIEMLLGGGGDDSTIR